MRGFTLCATLIFFGSASQVIAQTADTKAAPAPKQIPLEHFTKFDARIGALISNKPSE